MSTYCGIPIKCNVGIPEGCVVLKSYRRSTPDIRDPMEEYGVVLLPSGRIVNYTIADGRVALVAWRDLRRHQPAKQAPKEG